MSATIAHSVAADFEAHEWTFEPVGDFKVSAGRFALLPEAEYDALLAAAFAAEAIFTRQKWREDSTDPEAVALRMLRAAIAGAEGAK